jgi:hypothetical protein
VSIVHNDGLDRAGFGRASSLLDGHFHNLLIQTTVSFALFFEELMTALSPTPDSMSIMMIFTPMLKSIEIRYLKNVIASWQSILSLSKAQPTPFIRTVMIDR